MLAGPRQSRRSGFTLLELLVSLAVAGALFVLLLPALTSARASSRRVVCARNQRQLGAAWNRYLDDHAGRFPVLFVQPGWRYGGVRFSSIDGTPFLDAERPLNRYVPLGGEAPPAETLFRCPADRGITGTGRRTAYRAFGTSFRANARLLAPREAPDARQPEGLAVTEITTAPSRLVVMGDPFWYDARHGGGRDAAVWHGAPDRGNLLFLDGSVRFLAVEPEPRVGAAVFDPLAPEFAFPLKKP